MEELFDLMEKNSTPIEYIDRILYIFPDDSTVYAGFYVKVEVPTGYDIPYAYVLNCDGDWWAIYGGYSGCEGRCNLTIISRTRIYQREE